MRKIVFRRDKFLLLFTFGFCSSFIPNAFAADKPSENCQAGYQACYSINAENKPASPENLDNGKVVFAFGDDGCFPSAPVWYDEKENTLKSNPGQFVSRQLSFNKNARSLCWYKKQFDHSYIVYNELKSSNMPGYSARVFGIYAVKDFSREAILAKEILGYSIAGHRHEWEHAIVWMHDGKPEFVSVTQHSDTRIMKASDAPHLKNQPYVYAVKYIWGKTTHFPDFAGSKNHIATNQQPTLGEIKDSSGKELWFGERDGDIVDFSTANDAFKNIILSNSQKEKEEKWGETVPRINDPGFLNAQEPEPWKKLDVKF